MNARASYTVCTVNWRSAKYIRFLDHTLRKFADTPDFGWLICDTNETADETAELENLGGRVVRFDVGTAKGGVAHGTAFNHLLPMIQTPYAVLLDPDTAMLARGWDTRCLEALHPEDVVAVGAPYAPDVQSERYGDFPTVFFSMYKTEFLRRPGMDITPGHASWGGAARRFARRLAGVFEIDRDTGWKMREIAHAAGHRGLCFTSLNSESPEARVLTRGERGDEFHWQGRPIFTHQGRSNSRVPFQDPISVRWFRAVCRYLQLEPQQTSDALDLRLARGVGTGPRGELVARLRASAVPAPMRARFFQGFSTYVAESLPASFDPRSVVFVTTQLQVDVVKDIIALKAADPARRAYVFSTTLCPAHLQPLCERHVDGVVMFRDGFELAALLGRLPRGTPVVTRHRIPELVFATHSFPELRHVYKPHLFRFDVTPRLLEDHEGTTEFLVRRSFAVYHTEGDAVTHEARRRFSPRGPLETIHPGCLDELLQEPASQASGGELHLVCFSTAPHADVLPHERALTSGKLHLHVFAPPVDLAQPREEAPGLQLLQQAAARNPRVHVHAELPYEELLAQARTCDLALPHFEQPPEPQDTPVPASFFAALEAGLPLLVPRNARGMAGLVERHGVGRTVTVGELEGLADALASAPLAEWKQNVLAARRGALRYDALRLRDLVLGGAC